MLGKIVYIAGHQRSGTTLLSMLLGNHTEIISVGELRLLSQYIQREKGVCLCGSHLSGCQFWRAVSENSGVDPIKVSTSIDSNKFQVLAVSLLPYQVMKAVFRNGLTRNWRLTMGNIFRIYEAIFESTEKKIIVDSSKDPVTAKLTYMMQPDKVKIIYIHRDGRGVVNSIRKRNVAMDVAARTWKNTARKMRLIGGNLPENAILTVSYEDLCNDLTFTMQRVCDFIGIEMVADLSIIDKHDKHDIAGSPSITKNASDKITVSHDTSWKEGLSDSDIDEFNKIAGRENRRFGYV